MFGVARNKSVVVRAVVGKVPNPTPLTFVVATIVICFAVASTADTRLKVGKVCPGFEYANMSPVAIPTPKIEEEFVMILTPPPAADMVYVDPLGANDADGDNTVSHVNVVSSKLVI